MDSIGMAADKFDKEYAYNIRHNYGKEGGRKNLNAYGCMKIISSAPASGDHHGCPFRHFNSDQLAAKLRKNGLSNGAIGEIQTLIKNHHYQVRIVGALIGSTLIHLMSDCMQKVLWTYTRRGGSTRWRREPP